MYAIIEMLSIICLFAALTFIVRVVCAWFSEEVFNRIRRKPVVHLIWGGFAFLGVLLFFGILNPAAWPPKFLERRGQRQKVLERIQPVGGWEAVRLGCQELVTNYPDGLDWIPPRSNVVAFLNPQTPYLTNLDSGPLPAALLALKPKEIQYYPLELLRQFHDHPKVAVVKIKIFGLHSTGGHSTPYYGLEVPCGKGADSYEPRPSQGGVSGNRYTNFRKVADGVFEIY